MKNTNKLIILFLLLSQLVFAQQKSQLQAKIPFEIKNNAIVVKVTVNESDKPLDFIFDTGANDIVIDGALADSLGMKLERERNASFAGGSLKSYKSEGNNVSLGDLTLIDQRISTMPKIGNGIAGIIGGSLIADYIINVDFDSKLISLYSFGNYTYQGKGKAVPIIYDKGLVFLNGIISIVDKPVAGKFLLDTGAGYNVLCFTEFVKKNNLTLGFKAEKNGFNVAGGIRTPTAVGNISSFTFGGLEPVKNLSVSLMGSNGSQSNNWNPGFDGCLGFGLISRYNFTINLPKNEIYFVQNGLSNK